MPGRVQKATRPSGRSFSSRATKHHSGRIEPAANMLFRYCSTSLRLSGEPAASTKRSSSPALTVRVCISVVLLRPGVTNNSLGAVLDNHHVETHRPKGIGRQYTRPYGAGPESLSGF